MVVSRLSDSTTGTTAGQFALLLTIIVRGSGHYDTVVHNYLLTCYLVVFTALQIIHRRKGLDRQGGKDFLFFILAFYSVS